MYKKAITKNAPEMVVKFMVAFPGMKIFISRLSNDGNLTRSIYPCNEPENEVFSGKEDYLK